MAQEGKAVNGAAKKKPVAVFAEGARDLESARREKKGPPPASTSSPWAWLALLAVVLPLCIGLVTVFHHEVRRRPPSEAASWPAAARLRSGGRPRCSRCALSCGLFTLRFARVTAGRHNPGSQ